MGRIYKVTDITGSFGLFLDEEYELDEGENLIDLKEEIMEEICDNIGNYIDIELEEVEDSEEEDDN